MAAEGVCAHLCLSGDEGVLKGGDALLVELSLNSELRRSRSGPTADDGAPPLLQQRDEALVLIAEAAVLLG